MRDWLIVGVACVVLLALFMANYVLTRASQMPKSDTLAGCLPTLPTPNDYRVFPRDGREHLAVLCSPAILTLPSGGPIYVFDSAGKLVDWTSDSGEDPNFHLRNPSVSRGRSVTRDEVEKWAAGG